MHQPILQPLSPLRVYSPFGAVLEGRSWSAESGYRYGFQAQEEDAELWEGAVNYKYRIEDQRLGRFFSVDPLCKVFPWNGYYTFSENRVIDSVELEGCEKVEYRIDGKVIETFQWDQVDRASKEAFLRKHDMEGAFGLDYNPEDEQFANANSNEIWRFSPITSENQSGTRFQRYADEEALKNNQCTVFDMNGLLFELAQTNYALEGSSSPAMGSDLTEGQARALKNTAIIVGGVLTIVVTAGAATPAVTAAAATLEGFQVLSGTMAVAAGTAKMVLDLKGDFKNSDKIPTGYLGATIGSTLTVTMEDGKTQHVLKGSLTIIEGRLTFNFPAASLEAIGGNAFSVTNVVLDGDAQKMAKDVSKE